MYDPSPQIIAGLEPNTGRLAVYLVNAFRSAGIPLMVTSGRRSFTEQFKLVAGGQSRTFTSRHLTGRAFDVDVAGYSRDELPGYFWQALWNYAEALGLKVPLKSWDKGHFET